MMTPITTLYVLTTILYNLIYVTAIIVVYRGVGQLWYEPTRKAWAVVMLKEMVCMNVTLLVCYAIAYCVIRAFV